MTHVGTVISIHENPYPNHSSNLSTEEAEDLTTIRGNLVNVFKQLSKANESDPILALPIRFGLNPANSSKTDFADPSDAPSLLFYYIFDDWRTSYGLVSRSEHQYGSHLECLVRKG